MTADAPKLTAPTYIDARPPSEVAPMVRDAAGQAATAAADLCRKAPGSSLLGATLLGAVAAYFIPKGFDWLFDQISSRQLAADLEDDDDEGDD